MTFEEWLKITPLPVEDGKHLHGNGYTKEALQWAHTAGQESRQPEIDEQCRIIGMSGERELALRALVEDLEAKVSRYESDHPWEKALQDTMEIVSAENKLVRELVEKMREALKSCGTDGWDSWYNEELVDAAIAEADKFLGGTK